MTHCNPSTIQSHKELFLILHLMLLPCIANCTTHLQKRVYLKNICLYIHASHCGSVHRTDLFEALKIQQIERNTKLLTDCSSSNFDQVQRCIFLHQIRSLIYLSIDHDRADQNYLFYVAISLLSDFLSGCIPLKSIHHIFFNKDCRGLLFSEG